MGAKTRILYVIGTVYGNDWDAVGRGLSLSEAYAAYVSFRFNFSYIDNDEHFLEDERRHSFIVERRHETYCERRNEWRLEKSVLRLSKKEFTVINNLRRRKPSSFLNGGK